MVVVVSNPPGCLPVNTSGFKLARALYKAAVHPAQPEPMMTTFSIEPRSFTRIPQIYTNEHKEELALYKWKFSGGALERDQPVRLVQIRAIRVRPVVSL